MSRINGAVSVIVIDGAVPQSISTFSEAYEAEAHFEACVTQYEEGVSEDEVTAEDMETYLEEGTYENKWGMSVHLMHS